MPTFERMAYGRPVTMFKPPCKRCGGTGEVLQPSVFASRFNGARMTTWSWATCGECKGFGFLPEIGEGRR